MHFCATSICLHGRVLALASRCLVLIMYKVAICLPST
jgi:hypothetical protein